MTKSTGKQRGILLSVLK